MLTRTLLRQDGRAARAAVLRTQAVTAKTTLLLLRCRHLIEQVEQGDRLVAEEMLLWGWRGAPVERGFLDAAEALALLAQARAASELSPQARAAFLGHELALLPRLDAELAALAETRARRLAAAHARFTALVDARRRPRVEPVLPLDVLGLYVLLPQAPT